MEMKSCKQNDYEKAVEKSIQQWLTLEGSTYFDYRYHLCSFDLGTYFLLKGNFKLFWEKLKALGRPKIYTAFTDQLNPTFANSVAVVVTFHPDEEVLGNLRRLTHQFKYVVVVDNTPTSAKDFLLTEPAMNLDSVIIFSNYNRNGIAGAINKGTREIYKRFPGGWIFWFDQDSQVHTDFVLRANEILSKLPPGEACNTLFGVNYEDGKTEPQKFNDEIVDVKTVITSGSFTRIENLKRLGLCVEEMFIDSVDHEYCLRASRMGMRIRWITEPLMKHALGRMEVRSLLWKKDVIVTNHAPFRWFYFSRNHLFTCFEGAPYSFKWFIRHGYSLTKNFVKALLLEENRVAKVIGFGRGLGSGLKLIFKVDTRY